MWINTLELPPLLTNRVENTTYDKGPIVYYTLNADLRQNINRNLAFYFLLSFELI